MHDVVIGFRLIFSKLHFFLLSRFRIKFACVIWLAQIQYSGATQTNICTLEVGDSVIHVINENTNSQNEILFINVHENELTSVEALRLFDTEKSIALSGCITMVQDAFILIIRILFIALTPIVFLRTRELRKP